MRLAILADIHGNLPAFEAALEHAQRQHPDQIIIAGDLVVGSPDSYACWQLATRLGLPIIRGNHERYVAQYDSPQAPAIWRTSQFGPVRWSANQFTASERAELNDLPLSMGLDDAPELLIVHSSQRNDRDSIVAYTPASELAEMFPDTAAHIIIRGHNHFPTIRMWSERQIITVGSVGLPLDLSTTAQYLLLEHIADNWQITHHSVPYDIATSLRRFHETGYLEAAGPMAWLFMREVATASGQLVPFLAKYESALVDRTLTLEAAVQQFYAVGY